MTVLAIIIDIILALTILIWLLCMTDGEWISFVITAVIVGVVVGGELWYFHGTAAGSRSLKTQNSNFNKGIERVIKVYDVNGSLIQEYSGKFDIEYDENRILFDDENGKRHSIYYTTGTILIDEK